ncbi:hypothetical protein NOF04DRAFT_10755 [Fusarium oxysporum II5]|uniref:Long-chain-alcohol oxidase FAO2 n=4 Tax=Fusarium oxysporum species complex TaxID=171631 RepID=N1RT80_FUSC4|nr:uncharacterized protein FOIG_12161 [Fusarium odoratissimum NRRL 54006]EMT65475.1 Long-chain-alcohol oxidase FAO2 [Fusarium odoratissimum]EXL95151.1 hypothetical protein FOIG_12161 [Fusarium odoratissimum NRRL 54006]KAK2131411.1 hypothetical protein NOF04DRAFT_10755 [Fusarium oxysporum II5]TXC09005.1 hypothetical protein FocTR4_00005292 [Fusarium oxysporum f. sp. cubense]
MTVPQPISPLPQAPIATALPDAPPNDFFSPIQWDVFFALVDGVLPSITSESDVTDDQGQIQLPDHEVNAVLDRSAEALAAPATRDNIRAFLRDRPVNDARFRDNLMRTLAISPPDQLKRLAGLLSLMSTRPGSYFITGYWQPIYNQPAHVREAILKSWATSPKERWSTLAKTMSAMSFKAYSQTSSALYELSGYSDAPKDWQPKETFEYDFLQIEPGDDAHAIETDVVIIGSGCGGGVCAKNLAEAGHKVIVVDKAYHYPSTHLPMAQDAACSHLYDNAGFFMTEDSGCTVTSGSAWGGGGTVNWSVCLKPQDFVREEWADEGLPFFTSAEFDECLDRVWEFQGAGTDQIRHNHRNRVLLNGSSKLGWTARPAPVNTGGREHFCGQCHLGCGLAEKRGPAVSWLPDAAKAGAQFMEGFQVDKILFDYDGQTAIGIEGEWVSRDSAGDMSDSNNRIKRRVRVRAKKVILAAGSLWSPIVLKNSGITNPNVGANLHLHPCNFVTAVWKEETIPWEGGIITSYCPQFDNVDGTGYGTKLETTCMVPFTILSQPSWTSGLDAKLHMTKLRHMNAWISLTRDRDAGSVFPDPTTGRPRIDYTPSDFDRAHTIQGVEALAKICYVTGAVEIRPLLKGLEPFVRRGEASSEHSLDSNGSVADPETTDPAFATWLDRVREVGNKPPTAPWSSAHQMGTCRMSASSDEGVVDEKGRVWGTDNLYVADGSVFPSASGVNPMITIMAIADWISRGVDADLRA